MKRQQAVLQAVRRQFNPMDLLGRIDELLGVASNNPGRPSRAIKFRSWRRSQLALTRMPSTTLRITPVRVTRLR
jgi:hypothetical protein